MRATVIHAPYDIRVQEVPDPTVQQPTDVVLRVLRACVCGSDLWAYRGESVRQPGQRIGHEFLDGTIDPSPVFDLTLGLDEVPAGYKAMDERTALKVLIKP